MTCAAKICGLSTEDAIKAAVQSGASYVGFVFFAPSPRNISVEMAAKLAGPIPASVKKVGVFVNPDDDLLSQVTDPGFLDIIQLHGSETVERVREVKTRYALPVIKAIAISGKDDLKLAHTYEETADFLLFDAKPPKDFDTILPGGNGLVFDWELIKGQNWSRPYFLSGGLDTHNIKEAITISGAAFVDVSSGVEETPGKKNISKIKNFLAAIKDVS